MASVLNMFDEGKVASIVNDIRKVASDVIVPETKKVDKCLSASTPHKWK